MSIKKWSYYNDIDPFACEWTRQLIKKKVIPDGEVDERSIWDISPNELVRFSHCHFCNGIAVWAYALRQAGWEDDRECWTGSMPCQPFSAAGKRKRFADERHLWPAWFHLIQVCRPDTIFGEQVASKDGLAWLDIVQSDMEATGYTVGAADICAAGFGAPHKRNRLYFVAKSERGASERYGHQMGETQGTVQDQAQKQRVRLDAWHGCNAGPVALPAGEQEQSTAEGGLYSEQRRATNGFWGDVTWLYCRDGKARSAKPGTFPLVDGTSANLVRVCDTSEEIDANNTAEARMMRLRGYGNALCSPVAEAFIRAYVMAEMAQLKLDLYDKPMV